VEAAQSAGDGTRRIVALVAYDGTSFAGFQAQSSATSVPTIQGTLEDALLRFTTLQGRVVGAGRTDAGVHAAGQVVGAQLVWRHSHQDLQRAWNAHLPPTIVVRRVVDEPAPIVEGRRFHPRFSAQARTYRYTVVQQVGGAAGTGRSPLGSRFAHVEPVALDLNAMQQAAQLLVGTHDFKTFGRAPEGKLQASGEAGSTVRTVMQAEWQRVQCDLAPLEPGQEQTVVFTITANAFLQHMVRRLVGTLLEVGRGRLDTGNFGRLLAACNPQLAAPPAFAGGLVLETVAYAPVWGLRFHPDELSLDM
jgi:tRNA pseudouridine38-40 synthase